MQTEPETPKNNQILWAMRVNNADSESPQWKWNGATKLTRLIKRVGDLETLGEPVLVKAHFIGGRWRIEPDAKGGEYTIAIWD